MNLPRFRTRTARVFAFAALTLVPLAATSFASDDDDDDDDDDKVNKKAVAAMVRPASPPAAFAKGKIEVEKEDDDEQEVEFEAEHLLLGHTYFLFLESSPGSGTLVSLGEMIPEFDDASTKSDDDDDDDDSDDDDDNSDDDDDDDNDDDDDEFEVELKFKSKNGVGSLPLGVTDVETLAGSLVEVRDEGGVVYLTGVMPSLIGDFSPDTGKTNLDGEGKGKLRLRSVPKKAKHEFELELSKLNETESVTVNVAHPTTQVLTSIATLQLKPNGKGKLRLRTKKGDALPFGATSVEQLGGLTIEVRDATSSAVLLTGTIPQL